MSTKIIINKTGVATKNKGDGLSASDVNKINGTVNTIVDAINPILASVFNVNAELGNTNTYTLAEAIRLVPPVRRGKGLEVKYLNRAGALDGSIYYGDTTEDTDWENLDNWGNSLRVIDGGEW